MRKFNWELHDQLYIIVCSLLYPPNSVWNIYTAQGWFQYDIRYFNKNRFDNMLEESLTRNVKWGNDV